MSLLARRQLSWTVAMQSHTVPKRLLRQFSYRDISTGSWRLWRYEKGRPPSPKASPKTATRIDGHFADPSDAQLEADVERRLADEIEDPVNRFVVELCDPSFVMTDTQRGQMTQYITLLFNRSMARRAATRHIMDVRNYALKQFLENKSQLETVAVQWNLDAHFQGVRLERLITSEDVARAARRLMAGGPSASEEQKSYARSIVHAMAEFDETLFRGEWKLLGATQEVPFILSDAPVVTWERLAPDDFSYGIGFHRPNVEVFLPVSPLTCLQILPRVE